MTMLCAMISGVLLLALAMMAFQEMDTPVTVSINVITSSIGLETACVPRVSDNRYFHGIRFFAEIVRGFQLS
jgi:ABC-type sugar transport system substrate-binding protein